MRYKLVLQNGKQTGPEFARYVDAFNYRATHYLVGARIVEI